jgi:hypothetical protein
MAMVVVVVVVVVVAVVVVVVVVVVIVVVVVAGDDVAIVLVLVVVVARCTLLLLSLMMWLLLLLPLRGYWTNNVPLNVVVCLSLRVCFFVAKASNLLSIAVRHHNKFKCQSKGPRVQKKFKGPKA